MYVYVHVGGVAAQSTNSPRLIYDDTTLRFQFIYIYIFYIYIQIWCVFIYVYI